MTVRVILKSGVDFAIKCDKFTINRDGFGNVRGYDIGGIVENKPVYLDFEQVAAVVRVFSDERRWRTMNKALLSSKNMCWCTPQDFFDKLNAEFGFVLDPAATDKTAKCSLYYTPETDGLSQSWDRGGAVFCNPPYGREIGKWVQ
ncbi:MAG: DNA N-6-adenine-methyltransferase [Clostridium fessum]